ncbi:glycosyltransferase family 2 protein [Prochlorococcus sp. MIT 1307]|uniref:glycosyltransferase n=1 Tax=Prochlorococcus sp. MIT 1307 TaxID=3096219 RepID=UPI002A7474B7|nr:glycosyltransferase family 2 protein [Prochlorococcus sp. MIT 1307]
MGEKLLTTSLTIIVPTFNEESRINSCLLSLLKNINPCETWNILIVDDGSTDKTVEIVKNIQRKLDIPKKKLEIIKAGPRPTNERWVGKNWPCSRAIKQSKSTWLLFLDADVELANDTLKRALEQAIKGKCDLLSLAPRITCSCMAEWMVQPIIACLLAIGFPISKTNNPDSLEAFAAGPFMLFRQEAYNAIGGHSKVAGEVVEDIALARLIKSSGYKLSFLLGLDALDIRMYSNLSNLWEGWSKNWFLGLDRNITKALLASLIVFWMFSIPWIMFPIVAIKAILNSSINGLYFTSLIMSITSISGQLAIRKWCEIKFNFPTKYWYLMGIGGIIIGCIGPASVVKTMTGKGWTWKGRSLF